MRKLLYIFFLLYFHSSYSQKIFSVEYKSQADIKIFVVEYKSQADLCVYKVDYKSQAKGNEGLEIPLKINPCLISLIDCMKLI